MFTQRELEITIFIFHVTIREQTVESWQQSESQFLTEKQNMYMYTAFQKRIETREVGMRYSWLYCVCIGPVLLFNSIELFFKQVHLSDFSFIISTEF